MAIKKYITDDRWINWVIGDLKEYWPLTLRQIFYQLVGRNLIPNSRDAYQAVSRECDAGRTNGCIPWEAIEDRIRKTSAKRGFPNVEVFIEQELQQAFNGYERCLLGGQRKSVELWVEKDALSTIVINASRNYCVRVNTDRGFSSTSFVRDYVERASEAIGRGLEPYASS